MAKNYISLKCCQVTNFKNSNKSTTGKGFWYKSLKSRSLKNLALFISLIFSFLCAQEINAQAPAYFFAQSSGSISSIIEGTDGSSTDCSVNTSKIGAAATYCIPFTDGTIDYIRSFITTSGVSNINNPSNGMSGTGYGDFYAAHSASQYPGSSLNFIEVYQGGSHGFSIWVDFNNDGVFSVSERLYNASSLQTGFTGSINIPLATAPGDYRMRIRAWWNNLDPDPCAAYTSAWGEAEDYKLTVLSLTPCTGTPTAGVVTVNPNSAAPGSLYSVTASGFTTDTGQTFQWQYSDTGGPTWTNQGAATPSYNNLTGLTAPAFGVVRTWRLVVTCTASAQSANSLTGTFTSAYCIPSSTSAATYISNFSTTGGATNISNLNSGYTSGGYQDNFASQAVTVLPSATFAFNFTVVGGTLGAAIWIDWNNDGVFSNPSERVFVTSTYGSGPYNGTITVPGGLAAGNYRMRVRVDYNNSAPTDPCVSATRTETEDYKITVGVLPPCSGTPTAGAVIVNPASGQPGATYAVSASGFTGASGLTFQWQYSDTGGSTWTNQGGVTTSYNNLTGMIAPAFGIVRTWRLVVTCTASGIAANSLTGTFTSAYCSSFSTSTEYFIKNFATTGGLANISNLNTTQSPNGYGNYTSQAVSQYPGSAINFTSSFGFQTYYTFGFSIWIDWNNDGDFSDSGEQVFVSSSYNTSYLSSFSIPMAVVPGNYRMRVLADYYSTAPSNPCALSTTGPYGEVEDYTLQVLSLGPCATPTAQPTSLTLNVNAAVINGSFTAAVPAPNSYLVVVSTSATPPTIVNGTVYPIGSNIGANYTVVDNDSNTTFSASSLNSLTTYYFFIYSMSNFCTGGPLYLHTAPLTGSATTGTCVPAVSSGYQDDLYTTQVKFLGTLNDVTNTSTYSSSPLGYQDFTSLPNKSVQAQGGYINVTVQNNLSTIIKAWVDWDKDGNFAETEKVYDTGGNSTSAATFGFEIPSSQLVGDYRIRIRSNDYYGTYPYTACQLLINQSGETEDYLFTVVERCNTLITSVTDGVGCNENNTVVLGATASAGVTQFKWYSAITGGTLLGTTGTGTWTTPSITTTTNYYVTASNGSCEPQIRTLVVARVSKPTIISFDPIAPKICGDTEIVQITASVGPLTKDLRYLIKEDFELGLGGFTNTFQSNNSSIINAQSAWQIESSTFIPDGEIWLPAISSGQSANKFVMSTSDVGAPVTIENALISPVVSTVGFDNLTLKFDMYYSRYYPDNQSANLDYVEIYTSIDGGATWTTAASEGLRIKVDVGNPGRFLSGSYDLSAITGNLNVRFKIVYHAVWCDGVAIDNIEFFGPGPINDFKFDTTNAAAFTNALATIPYISGTPATSIYVKPTLTQLENGVLSIPVTTNSNLCGPSVNITNNTKSFTAGTASTDWNTAANWKPAGVPTATNCVIILDDDVEVNGTNFSALGFDLSIKDLAKLTVKPSNNIFLTDKVNISPNGELRINNSGSLIQTNNVPNIGTGVMKMERAANIRKFDYVYWSSPVTTASAFSTTSISPLTSSSLIYKWLPTISTNINGFGNWTSGIENMVSGKGYIVRGPDSFSNTPTSFTTTFAGTPANGTISIPIQRGTWNGGNYSTGISPTPGTNEDDNWNLVGNPYPSAIKAIDFLTANTSIDGFINIWTHGSMPNATIANPFYGTFGYNYNLSDYITYNSSGASTGPGTFNGYIPAGQGFFVAMLHTSTTPGNLTFTNALRSTTHNNSVFYRGAAEQDNAGEGRIWLDIVADDGRNVRTLVAYVEGATNDRDRLYDAITDYKEDLNLFSNIGDDIMRIQGRQAPFDQTDLVSIGIKVPTNGIYNIAIAAIDGLFENDAQNIYLEDENTGIIHNLRENPYTFSAESGIDAERFILRYTNQTLGNADFGNDSPKVLIASSNQIEIKSTVSEIKSVRVFDVAGRQLANYADVNSYDFALSNFRKLNSTLIIQVTLANDLVVNKKIIF